MHDFDLGQDQLEGVASIIQIIEGKHSSGKRICYLTGAAGTGKTSIMRKVLQHCIDNRLKVSFAAPTGKAAKRATQATGHPCVTIHRLLEYTSPGELDEKTGKHVRLAFPRRTNMNPLVGDVVVIDEYSMVSHELHRNILDAAKDMIIIAVGDINQLPPVSDDRNINPDNLTPFAEIIKKCPGTTLTKVHRSSNSIPIQAAKILDRKLPEADGEHVFIVKALEPVSKLMQVVDRLIALDRNIISIDHQLLVPTNVGKLGVITLNTMLQEKVNPDKPGLRIPANKAKPRKAEARAKDVVPLYLREGDKIICTKNFSGYIYVLDEEGTEVYDENKEPRLQPITFFNGEMGIVTSIDFEQESITIDFGDRMLELPRLCYIFDQERGETTIPPQMFLELGYAITIHKSQGDQFQTVVAVLHSKNNYMINRAMAYTACTRAQDRLVIVTDLDGQASMLRTLSTMEMKKNIKRK